MGTNSKIEWTDATWNPIIGCSPISAGCEHCYARGMARRLSGSLHWKISDPYKIVEKWDGTIHLCEDRLDEPKRWKKPRRIFVCSMGDLFHNSVNIEHIKRVFDTIRECPQHTFILLTKRADNMYRILSEIAPKPLPNVWCGATVENQDMADQRIHWLKRTPAAVQFVSCEPLLKHISLDSVWGGDGYYSNALGFLDWVICGGETGPGARPMNIDWARSLRDICRANKVPFFFKKVGGSGPDKKSNLLDGVANEEFPQ
jgi:protein gp37